MSEYKEKKEFIPVSSRPIFWLLPYDFVCVAAIIDFYSRKIKGWIISKGFDRRLIMEALNDVLSKNTAQEFRHSNQGVQYCFLEYTDN